MSNQQTCFNCININPITFDRYVCVEPLNRHNANKPFEGVIKLLDLNKNTCKFWSKSDD